MLGEARIITEVRKKLIDKYYDASPEDRLRLRQDIENAEKDLRQLGIYHKAIGHVPENQNATVTESTEETIDPPPEFRAWLDAFNDYARKQNEPWRAELLARALALESQTPGSIGQRALWFIGTVDDKEFHSFAALLNISTKIYGNYVIPNFQPYITRKIPNYDATIGTEVGHALFRLGNLGLYGDVLQSEKKLIAGQPVVLRYDTRQILAMVIKPFEVRGILLTALGDTLAKLYDPITNELGVEIFNAWLESIKANLEIVSDTENA